MSRDAHKKEKHRLKRKQKQAKLRRQKNVSVARQLALGELLRCSINDNWKESGLASFFVLKRLPGGTLALGGFLVDIWCAGLKEAWARTQDVLLEDWERLMDRAAGPEQKMIPCDPAMARRLLAGGIRFSRQNGFRLPHDWPRWVEMLSPLPDAASADLSDFYFEGDKLHFIGDMEWLRRHLIGCTPEEFFARPNVHYTLGVGSQPADGVDQFADEFDEEEGDWDESGEKEGQRITDARLMDTIREMAEEIRAWCQRKHLEPAPELESALMLDLVATSVVSLSESAGHAMAGTATTVEEATEKLLGKSPPDQQAALRTALEQVHRYMAELKVKRAILGTQAPDLGGPVP